MTVTALSNRKTLSNVWQHNAPQSETAAEDTILSDCSFCSVPCDTAALEVSALEYALLKS